jgi:uncharacterized protein
VQRERLKKVLRQLDQPYSGKHSERCWRYSSLVRRNHFYLRQIVRLAGVGQGAAQRELSAWVDSGLLVRSRRGQQVYYRANRDSLIFGELKALAVKTAGIADVLREAITRLRDRITLVFVHGSVAEQREKAGSDVDMIVVGDVTFGDVAAALQPAQESIGREVNPTVYSEKEFQKKLRARVIRF